MSKQSFKIDKSIVLKPVDLTTLTSPQEGELAIDINDSNKLKKYSVGSGLWVEIGSGGGTGLPAPGASGNVLTSDGTNWVSMPVGGGSIATYNATLSNGLIYPIWDFTNPTKLANPVTLPPNTSRGTAWSPDGQFLSVAYDTTPFITIYQRSGTTFTKLANPAALPAGNGLGTSWSPDGQFLTVAHEITPFITIYRTSSDTPSANGSPVTTTVINREIK